jgi:hypothetical protein
MGQALVVFPRPEGADRSGAGGVSAPGGRRSVRRRWISAPRGRRSVRYWWFFRAQRAQIGQVLVVFPRPEGADRSGAGGFPRPEGTDRSGSGGFSAPRGRRSVRCWWCFRALRAQIGQVLVVFPRQEGADRSDAGGFPRPESADRSGTGGVSAPGEINVSTNTL